MDDNHDKEMMRNQVIAIILMCLLVVVWFKFFMPPPVRTPQPAPQQTTAPAPQNQPQKESATPTAEVSPDAWAQLPPVPQDADPAADEVALADEDLELVFTRIGARLKKATVLLGKEGKRSVQLVPDDARPDTQAVYPLGLAFTEPGLADELNRRRFDVEKDPSGRAATFSLTIPGKAIIRKHYSLSEKKHVLDLRVDYQNLENATQILGMDQTPAYYLSWAPNLAGSEFESGSSYKRQSIVWYKGKSIEELPTNKLKDDPPSSNSTVISSPQWVAIKNEYFLAAVTSPSTIPQAVVSGNPTRFQVSVAVPRFEVAPDAAGSTSFTIYLGPSEQRALAQGWDSLPEILRFFSQTWNWMDWFAKLLLGILNWFYLHVIANYGLAIIFLTVIVRLAMYPLTLKSMRSMKKMQLLAPEIEELKRKYGEDPQEMNRKMMELYRERGVNPLGGCFPMLLQMPVFIALYRMLWYAYELRGAHFVFWINDLSQADKLFHMPWMVQVPFIGGTFEYFNLLPILMGASMVLNQKMMPSTTPAQNQQQKVMMTIMPIFFTFICYTMPAGLNLYILTSTLLGMVQQYFTSVSSKEMEPKKKTVGKRQHFYTAAKARQRAMKRETKKQEK